MLMRFLRKLFIKDYKNLDSSKVRNNHGILMSIYGIIANIFLSVLKIVFGLFAKSISIISDSINNVSDSANSVVSLVGFKISDKPADKEHPFGHARMEYIAGIVISTIIIAIGGTILVQSIMTIIEVFNGTADPLQFSYWTISILIVSIVVKIFLTIDNSYTGKLIGSPTLKATARDALSDILVTSGLLISTLVMFISGEYGVTINIDGWMGAVVSIFIIVSGIRSLIDTANPLLGVKASKEEVDAIVSFVKTNDGVLGVHDVVVHNYGGRNRYITLHVEVDGHVDVMESHELIDSIEMALSQRYEGSNVLIHMDPIDTKNPLIKKYSDVIQEYITNHSEEYSFHDLRIVPGKKHSNVIFDLVVPFCKSKKEKERTKYVHDIIDEFEKVLKEQSDIPIDVIINIDYPMS